MSKRIPYDVWLVGSDGKQTKLLTFFSDTQSLSLPNVKTEAIAALQDLIDTINDPGPGQAITAQQGIIAPVQYHIRLWRLQQSLE